MMVNEYGLSDGQLFDLVNTRMHEKKIDYVMAFDEISVELEEAKNKGTLQTMLKKYSIQGSNVKDYAKNGVPTQREINQHIRTVEKESQAKEIKKQTDQELKARKSEGPDRQDQLWDFVDKQIRSKNPDAEEKQFLQVLDKMLQYEKKYNGFNFARENNLNVADILGADI